MLMVVFGAGASHGCRREEVESGGLRPPPLTAGLFAERYGEFAARYPASRAAIVRLRNDVQQNPDLLIESAIGRLYEEARGDPERARHLLALRFYLTDLIQAQANLWS